MEPKWQNHAKVFKAFCDENRLMILSLLQAGEKCACELLDSLEISQPTLSHHMKILCDSGIVKSCKNGKLTYYCINPKGIEHANELLIKITTKNSRSGNFK